MNPPNKTSSQEKVFSGVAYVNNGPSMSLVKVEGDLLTVKKEELIKYQNALLSQARREYMTSLAERVRGKKGGYRTPVENATLDEVARMIEIEKDLEK